MFTCFEAVLGTHHLDDIVEAMNRFHVEFWFVHPVAAVRTPNFERIGDELSGTGYWVLTLYIGEKSKELQNLKSWLKSMCKEQGGFAVQKSALALTE